MSKALVYEAQVKRLGDHSKAVQKSLKTALKGARDSGAASDNPIGSSSVRSASIVALRAGTHLVREWNGRPYQVEVLENGFRLDGRTYKSLSAIARKITGAHWSGPRFFGVGR